MSADPPDSLAEAIPEKVLTAIRKARAAWAAKGISPPPVLAWPLDCFCPLALRPDQYNNVVVLATWQVTHVGDGALRALAALMEAGPRGLTARELNERTGARDARGELKNLRTHNDLLKPVLMPPASKPGRPRGEGGRWRLVRPAGGTT